MAPERRPSRARCASSGNRIAAVARGGERLDRTRRAGDRRPRRHADARHGRGACAPDLALVGRARHQRDAAAARGARAGHRAERAHHARPWLHQRLLGRLTRRAHRTGAARHDRRRLPAGPAAARLGAGEGRRRRDGRARGPRSDARSQHRRASSPM